MARDIASALYDRLNDEFPPRKAYRPADFDQSILPSPIRQFLKHYLEQAVQQETRQWKPATSPWFDLQHPEVQRAEAELRSALARNAHIPQSEWENALHEACYRVTRYLVRPVQTAVRYIFPDENRQSVPVKEAIRRLEALGAYPYLRESVRTYVDQRDLESLDRTRLETMLTRVDQQMVDDYEAEEWIRLMKPLFEVANVAFRKPALPADLLQSFFSAKKQEDMADRFSRQSGTLARDDVLRVLTSTQEAMPEPEPKAPPKKEPEPQSTNGQSADDGGEAVPLWKQFQQGGVKRGQTKTTEGGDPRWAQFQPERTSKEEPSWTLEELEDQVLGQRGTKNRSRYVRHLFNGSEQNYKSVLKTLRGANSWSEASKIIAKEVFRKNEVNIYSDPAVSFTNAVEAQQKK